MSEIKVKHDCRAEKDTKETGYGLAVDNCYEENGKLFITNGEYGQEVKYCPFCGMAASDLDA